MAAGPRGVVLTLTCAPDRPGIVHDVSGLLFRRSCNIEDSQQFADPIEGRFFMRVAASLPDGLALEDLRGDVRRLADSSGLEAEVWEADERPPIVILVSKTGHCLNDLLYRQSSGTLPAEIAAVVSNHPDLGPLTEAHGVPFVHLPVSSENRAGQEAEIAALVERSGARCVVLARYMQILSPWLVDRLQGVAINIPHGLLPAFVGASPYRQAYERGVKIIGATAHFVTSELDEGPIIEQAVSRVDHRATVAELTRIGEGLECQALYGAVRSFLEHRVMLAGSRTVVFG